jgi:transcriptional regulator with XRE-family HTH domain
MGIFSQAESSPKWGARARSMRISIPYMGNNLKALRNAARMTQQQAADAMGLSKGGYVKVEDGDRRLTADYIARAARAFGVREAEVIQDKQRVVPVVGYVGAGAEAFFYAGQGPFDEVDAPHGATEDTVAVEIRGTSLGELFDRWLIFYDQRREPVTSDLIGTLCVIGLDDQRVLVKKLKRGQREGKYDLISNTEPPIYDATVIWAARVKQMVPR